MTTWCSNRKVVKKRGENYFFCFSCNTWPPFEVPDQSLRVSSCLLLITTFTLIEVLVQPYLYSSSGFDHCSLFRVLSNGNGVMHDGIYCLISVGLLLLCCSMMIIRHVDVTWRQSTYICILLPIALGKKERITGAYCVVLLVLVLSWGWHFARVCIPTRLTACKSSHDVFWPLNRTVSEWLIRKERVRVE